jgi:hypothetical protein
VLGACRDQCTGTVRTGICAAVPVGFLRYQPGAGFPLHKHDFAQIYASDRFRVQL